MWRTGASQHGLSFEKMSIADIAVEAAHLTVEERRQLLARLPFELTIAARATYVPDLRGNRNAAPTAGL